MAIGLGIAGIAASALIKFAITGSLGGLGGMLAAGFLYLLSISALLAIFRAVIDTARMTLAYCNAGHNPPILRRRDGAIEWLREGGPVLGVLPAASYPAGAIELRPGDCLALFTDGISEAFNAAGEEFGEKRIIQALNQPAGGAEEIRLRIMAAATEFSNGDFHDDATLMIAAMR